MKRRRFRSLAMEKDMEALWPRFKVAYAKWLGVKHKGAVGAVLLEVVDEVMKALGDYLYTEDGKVAKATDGGPVGDAKAFAKFVEKANGKMPVASSSLVV